jgi:metal-sulfur cluster biosynthetic enzyme
MNESAAGRQVREALNAVVEPDLGRPITELGFVAGAAVDGGRVHVRLRVPSFFRLERYGWLIVADARAALSALPWADTVEVCFTDDHPLEPFDVSASEQRRSDVRRAVFLERQHRIVRSLLDGGMRRTELCRMTVADLAPTAETAVYLQRRAEVLLPTDSAAPLLMTEDGWPVRAEDVDDYLARLRVATATRD